MERKSPEARPGRYVAIPLITPTSLAHLAWVIYPGLSGLPGESVLAAELFAARALVVYLSTKTGKRERQSCSVSWPISMIFPFFGEAGHGIYRQSF